MKKIFEDDFDVVSIEPAVTIESMVTEDGLTIVAGLSKRAKGGGEG